MRLSRFFTLALVGAAAAVEIKDALGTIKETITKMNTQIKAWDGVNVTYVSTVLESAEGLMKIIKSATADVNTIKEVLPLNKAVTILQPANDLTKSTADVITSLIDIKDKLAKAQEAFPGIVKKVLTDIKGGAKELVDAIKTKLPANVQTVGDSIAKNIDKELDRGIAKYT